jgi:hypothetical protein
MSKTKSPVSIELLRNIPSVGIALLIGSEGAGKSVLAYGILEALKDSGRDIVNYGFPLEKSIYLPDWIKVISTFDFPEESIVIVDEAYLQFHSRDSSSGKSKFMDVFSGLVRQKDILAVYITQTTRRLDIGLVSAPRVLLIKQPSLLQMRLDRSELRPIIADASKAFHELEFRSEKKEPKQVMDIRKKMSELGADTMVDPRCLVATYVVGNRFEGLIDLSNTAPSFWSEELSKAWKGISLLQEQPTSLLPSKVQLCCDCDEPIIGICSCHLNGYCKTHMEGHTILERR